MIFQKAKNLALASLPFFKRVLKLPKFLSQKELWVIYAFSFLILICLIFKSINFFAKKNIIPDFGGTYTEGLVGKPKTFIPILAKNEVDKDISKLIFSGLIKFNEKREIIPDLAEKWEIKEGNKIYELKLKEAKWHDGEGLKTDDITFTVSLIKNEEIESPYFEVLKEVEIKTIDEKTVQFILKNPCAPFLSHLDFPILPKHLLEKVAPSDLGNSDFAKKPIGTGSFKFKKIENKKDVPMLYLEANENYFKKPYLSYLIFKFYPEKEVAQRALKSKKIQGFFQKEEKGKKVLLPQYTALFFNENSDIFSKKSIRKALAYATSKNEIKNELKEINLIDFPILPGFLGYKEGKKYEYNLDKAKELISEKEGKELTLLTNGNLEHQITASILKNQWEKIGVKVNIRKETNSELEKSLRERNYDALLIGQDLMADPDPYPFWHSSFTSGSGFNLSSFSNKEVDKLLEEARQTLDQNKRKEKYEKFIDIISEDVPAIFLYQPIYYFSISDKIKGVSEIEGVTNSDRFWNIENWYIKTKRVK